ncbi:alpha/beta hydrolase [uncultured Paludibaculum sp.]|uniref:alpha/beta fold hydrolase n=1 Tax=uncultured Paludibaculum sp. TaxID=1765020 RepID=UPI002AAAC26C|nr:alpha/beta hydrolase [uncultured Paludibaculum sp.]
MSVPAYYPYRSLAVRDEYFAHYDSLAARDWPVVSEERMVPTSGGATFVRISGPSGAPPLVLLPGAGATSLMWAPNVRSLSQAYRTFAVDQMGELGRSTCTQPVRNLDDLVRWLDELFDGLELSGGINLAGLSYGGALTAQYALRFPKRLRKAILLAPGATVLRLGAGFVIHLVLAAVASRRGLPLLFRWLFEDMIRKDPAWLDATLKEIFILMHELQRRKTPIPPVISDAEWGGLSVPTLFLVGEHEKIYSARKAVERLKRVAPQVRSTIVPGAGHDLTFVQADVVNRLIIEFLDG